MNPTGGTAGTPTVTNATTKEDTQSTSGLVITANTTSGDATTNYKITGITGGTLFKNDGTTQITNGTFITKAEGLAGLKFTPTLNQFGTTGFGFNIQASTTNTDGGLGGSAIAAAVTVTPVADTPSVTNATTTTNTQTTSGLVVTRNAADGAEVTYFKITGITGGSLFLNNGTTPVNNGDFVLFADANAGFKFTPTTGFTGSASFQVQASTSNVDAGLGGAVITATITVSAPAPTLSIDDVTQNEGNSGTTTFTFTVTLSAPAPAGGVTFDIATADGTATTANNDYVARSLTGQTIPAGQTSYTFAVTVNGDTTVEPNETFFVNVTNVTGATVTDGQGLGTITNDDSANQPPTITAPNGGNAFTTSVPENTTAVVTVTATDPEGQTLSYTLTGPDALKFQITSGGVLTFAAAPDFESPNSAANSNTYSVTVNVSDGNGGTDTQDITVNVTDVAVGTFSFAQAAYSITEGNSGTTPVTITVTRTGGTDAASVNYSTAPGTATAGSDYTTSTGTLNFGAGVNSQTFIVNVLGDTTFEPDEVLSLSLSGATNGGAVGAGATLTILNDDTDLAPVVTLPSGPAAYTENGPAVFLDSVATVTDADSANFDTGVLTVDYTSNGTADDRLEINNQGTGAGQIGVTGGNTVTFAGAAIGTFTGGTGTTPLVVTFNASATPAAVQALLRNVTFRNVSDAPLGLARAVRVVVTDGDGGTSAAVTQTVNVTTANDPPVNTVPGSALSVSANGTLTVTGISVADPDAGTGSISVTVSVPAGSGTFAATNGGGVTVADTGTAAITLTGTLAAVNTFIAGGALSYTAPSTAGNVTVTVVSNDNGNTGGAAQTDTDTFTITVGAQPTVSLSVSPAVIAENGGTTTLTATLSAVSPVNVVVTVLYTGSATNGTDYTAATTITVLAGQLTGTATVTALDDALNEGNESISASISSATFATPTGGPAAITITDDDAATVVSITRSAATPTNAGAVSWTITFSQPVSGVALANFVLTATGTVASASQSVAPVGGTAPNTTYVFTATGVTGDGTLDLDFGGNAGITPAVSTTTFDGPAYTIDRTAPDTTLTATPPAVSTSASVSFSFTGTDPVTGGVTSGVARFEVSLDGSAFVTATSPFTASGLSEGSHTFQVRAVDAAGNVDGTPASYTFVVDAVNAPPKFVVGTPPTVNEDAGAQTVPGFATGFDPGSPEESGQTAASYTVTVTGTTGNLAFSSAPAVAPDGTLTYTAAPNTNGTATFTVTVTDSGGATSSPQPFTITVTAVNDAPSFTTPVSVTVSQDSGAYAAGSGFAQFAPGGGSDETAQTATYTVTNSNNALFSAQPSIAPNGTLTFTPAAGASGTATVTVTVRDSGGGTDTSTAKTFTITVTPALVTTPTDDAPVTGTQISTAQTAQFIAIGTDVGTPATVRVLSAATRAPVRDFAPFGGFTGGVKVALGDVNGDGKDDLIVGTATLNSHVRAFDIATGRELYSFFAFPGFTGGVDLAAGDVNGDGKADIVVGSATQTSHVKVFSGATGAELFSFLAFPGFTGGIKVAAGDVTGDGKADIAVLAGPGGNGHVKVFGGATGATVTSFFGYAGYLGEIDLSVGDVDGNGVAEVVTAAQNPTNGTHIKAFDKNAQTVRSFFAPTSAGATFQRSDQFPVPLPGTTARVSVADVDGDKIADYLLGSQPTAGPSKFLLINGATGAAMANQFAFDPIYGLGIYVEL